MKHEMALLETAASNLEKGDEMSFIWLNQWQKHNFQRGRRAKRWSPQRKGYVIHSVSSWKASRETGQGFGLRGFTVLIYLVTFLEKKKLSKDTLKLKT